MFVLWFCTLHVFGLSFCVFVLVPLFHVLNLALKFFFMLFSFVIFVHLTPCEVVVGWLVKTLDCGQRNDYLIFTLKKFVIGVILVYKVKLGYILLIYEYWNWRTYQLNMTLTDTNFIPIPIWYGTLGDTNYIFVLY